MKLMHVFPVIQSKCLLLFNFFSSKLMILMDLSLNFKHPWEQNLQASIL